MYGRYKGDIREIWGLEDAQLADRVVEPPAVAGVIVGVEPLVGLDA